MTDYTATEIEDVINDEASGFDSSWYEFQEAKTITLRGETVPVEHVASEGGEGQGDSIWFVVKIGDQLFRKDGYYASHYGTDWDGDFCEVKPVEKTITVYEAA